MCGKRKKSQFLEILRGLGQVLPPCCLLSFLFRNWTEPLPSFCTLQCIFLPVFSETTASTRYALIALTLLIFFSDGHRPPPENAVASGSTAPLHASLSPSPRPVRMLEDKFSPPALLPSATAWFRAVTIGTTTGCPLV